MAEEREITLKEAAAITGTSADYLRVLANKKRIRARKIGRDWVTTAEAVAEYLRNTKLRSRDPYKNRRS